MVHQKSLGLPREISELGVTAGGVLFWARSRKRTALRIVESSEDFFLASFNFNLILDFLASAAVSRKLLAIL